MGKRKCILKEKEVIVKYGRKNKQTNKTNNSK